MKKNPKLQFGDQTQISNYKVLFSRGYTPDTSEDAFLIKHVNVFKHRERIVDIFRGRS